MSLSFIMHLVFFFIVFAVIPKSEKFTTISLQTGAIGVKAVGMKGTNGLAETIKPQTVIKASPPIKKNKSESLPILSSSNPQNSAGENSQAASSTQGGSGSGSMNGGSGNGGGKETPLSRYVQKVVTLIESHKSYPSRARSLGQQGTVSLKIKLDHAGKLLEMDILGDPPYKILVNAAKDTISSIGNFPSMPDDVTLDTLTMNVPIRYELVE